MRKAQTRSSVTRCHLRRSFKETPNITHLNPAALVSSQNHIDSGGFTHCARWLTGGRRRCGALSRSVMRNNSSMWLEMTRGSESNFNHRDWLGYNPFIHQLTRSHSEREQTTDQSDFLFLIMLVSGALEAQFNKDNDPTWQFPMLRFPLAAGWRVVQSAGLVSVLQNKNRLRPRAAQTSMWRHRGPLPRQLTICSLDHWQDCGIPWCTCRGSFHASCCYCVTNVGNVLLLYSSYTWNSDFMQLIQTNK